MHRAGRFLLIFLVLGLMLGFAAAPSASNDAVVAMVIGRTGEVLHIATPQPVKVGSIFAIKPFESEDAIAEAEVMSCTHERPYIALARVIRGDTIITVPTGVRAYTDLSSVLLTFVPLVLPVIRDTQVQDRNRFSVQVGAFYPSVPAVRDSTASYWQAYRLNYNFVKIGRFEGLIAGEYMKGSKEFDLGGDAIRHTVEVIPVTAMLRFKSLRMGHAHLFLGAGAGLYRIRTQQAVGSDTTEATNQQFGQEYSVGMESTHGWVMELRYRNVPDTDIKGYALTVGSRF